MNKLGIYIHIPFCRQKCLYCDFSSYSGFEHLFKTYTAALCQQIADQGGVFCKSVVDTIYIGGGTPSLLPINLLEKIVKTIYTQFSVETDAEISMEANPGTVTQAQLAQLKAAGVNRLSLGVQSFANEQLSRLGRIHRSGDSLDAISWAQAGGFNSLNIDLMYGLPGQTVAGFNRDLEQAVALGISHISVYGLKIEEGTPLADAYDNGRLHLPDETEDEAMYDLMVEFLSKHGLRRYEISNFAKQGHECRHNLKYWRYQPYLGLGAAAHSFLDGQRTSAEPGIEEYIRCINAGRSPLVMQEKLELAEAMAEYVFLALRTTTGLKFSEFIQHFKVSFCKHYQNIVDNMAEQNLIAIDDERIWLTDLGMKYGNVVFRSFLPDK